MSVIAGAAALLLSACGVQIQMTTLQPAEIDLGRGAPLTVQIVRVRDLLRPSVVRLRAMVSMLSTTEILNLSCTMCM